MDKELLENSEFRVKVFKKTQEDAQCVKIMTEMNEILKIKRQLEEKRCEITKAIHKMEEKYSKLNYKYFARSEEIKPKIISEIKMEEIKEK